MTFQIAILCGRVSIQSALFVTVTQNMKAHWCSCVKKGIRNRSVCVVAAGVLLTRACGYRPKTFTKSTLMMIVVFSGITNWAGVEYSIFRVVTRRTWLELKGRENC